MYYDLLHLVYLHRSPRTPVLVPAKSLRTPQNVINVACISNLVKSIQAFGKCKSHRFLASANFEKKNPIIFGLQSMVLSVVVSGDFWRVQVHFHHTFQYSDFLKYAYEQILRNV